LYLTHLFPEETAKNHLQIKDVEVFLDENSISLALNFLKDVGVLW